MNNLRFMEQHFERNKNIQAAAYTILVCCIAFLVFTLVSWKKPLEEKPLLTEGIEVNLGNSDVGDGDVQPQSPGEPAPVSNDNTSSTPANASNANTDDKPDTNEPDDIPATTNAKPVIKPVTTNTNTKPSTKPVTNPTPTPIKPKATMGKNTGGNGTGGNNSDSYNNSKGEGNDGKPGDKGKPWGSVDGKVYDGPGGTKIYGALGKRGIRNFPSFNDEFEEDAKVAVNVVVDANGNVIEATINPKGTSATQPKTKQVALRRAREIKFNKGTETQSGTIILDMRVRG